MFGKNKKPEHIIKSVEPGSIAEEINIEPGDILVSVNGNTIGDVFDYRYYINDEYIEVVVRKKDGEEWLLEIDKDYDEDLGIEFENSLMSDYRSCSNKCIFCFIDQMPPGMRETLYFKDDDSRLSFLQGNYITLTNMNDEDIDRIVKMHLAPINISVHTTEPELRSFMLHNRFAGEKLKYIKTLYDNHIEMNGQIVLCRGINDGEHLEKTINDLAGYLPFMKSVSVVPAGITKYREGLYPLELFSKEEACDVIDMIEAKQSSYYERYGLHFIHASDEWYILAERPFPAEEMYDDYIQLENGVGMMRLFINDAKDAIEQVKEEIASGEIDPTIKRTITIATGMLAYRTMREISDEICNLFPNFVVDICAIENRFFGETITVTGLITGQDLIEQVSMFEEQKGSKSDFLMIPQCMLRAGENVFLDDVTTDEVVKTINMPIVINGNTGSDFVRSIIGGSA